MDQSHKYLFIHLLICLIFVYVDQLIFFFVLITHEIALDTRLYVIVFLFVYNPVILYITLLVENARNIFSIFRVIYVIISFLVAVVRERSLFRNESMYQGRVFI